MAIIDVQLHWLGSTGSHAEEGPEYTAVYRVTTDDYTDQSQTVILWFRANVLDLGTPYLYSGDTYGSVALAKRIRAKRYRGGRFVWEVQVDYAPPTEESGEDEDGNPTDNPLEFRPIVSFATVQYQKPVEWSEFRGGYYGTAAANLPVGSLQIPQNSNHVPFDPLREKDDARLVISIDRNMPNFDGDQAEQWCRCVNAERVRFNYRFATADCNPLTLKIRDWKANARMLNGIFYWETTLQIERNRDTWVEEICDRGYEARAIPGDPDGRGGTVTELHTLPGVPKVRRLVDLDETPLSAPVLLDGDGGPLDISFSPIVPVWGKWLHYDQKNYHTLPILSGVIDP